MRNFRGEKNFLFHHEINSIHFNSVEVNTQAFDLKHWRTVVNDGVRSSKK